MYVCVCVHACMHTLFQMVKEARRGFQIFWSWGLQVVVGHLNMRVLQNNSDLLQELTT